MKAALDGRSDPSLVVMGRTGAVSVTGLDDAIARAKAYEATGVDALFFTGIKNRGELEAISAATRLPIVLGGAPEDMTALDYLASQRVRIALQGHAPFAAATQAVYETLKALREGTSPKSLKGLASSELTGRATALDIRAVSSDISVMTETTDKKKLPAAVERFILHWGDMGDEWGVNRSVSQIHGLLYLAEAPMTAEDIAETLGMARSNVSNSIKELLAWNLIRRVPILGDRRDHFEAETDIWEVAARIAAGRKEREIDPAVDALRACVSDAADDPTISPVASKRLKEMLAFTELVDRWYMQMLNVPRPRLVALIKLGEKIVSFLPVGENPNRAEESKQERVMASTRLPRLPATPASNTILLDDRRFHDLLPDEEWGRLPLAIWRRFSKRFADGETVVYVGTIEEASFSRAGWWLAQLARVIGGPLPTGAETGVPMVVTVTEDAASGGQIWTRICARSNGFPQVIHSAKRFAGPTGLEEYVGYGVSMALRISVEHEALVFRSVGYSLQIGPLRLPLPPRFTPGDLTVTHSDLGGGMFRFTLEIVHPRFGMLIRQSAVFREAAS